VAAVERKPGYDHDERSQKLHDLSVLGAMAHATESGQGDLRGLPSAFTGDPAHGKGLRARHEMALHGHDHLVRRLQAEDGGNMSNKQSGKAALRAMRCPFCNDLELALDCNTAVYWVHCQACGADGPHGLTRTGAVASWNNGTYGKTDALVVIRQRNHCTSVPVD
jgi:hypothetical protein